MDTPKVDSHSANLSERTQEAWDATKVHTADTLRESGAFVRANPIPVVLGMLAVSFVLGALLMRKETTLQERYVDEPLDNLKSILSDLNARAARQAGRGGDAASDAMHSLAGRIKRGIRFW